MKTTNKTLDLSKASPTVLDSDELLPLPTAVCLSPLSSSSSLSSSSLSSSSDPQHAVRSPPSAGNAINENGMPSAADVCTTMGAPSSVDTTCAWTASNSNQSEPLASVMAQRQDWLQFMSLTSIKHKQLSEKKPVVEITFEPDLPVASVELPEAIHQDSKSE